MQYRPQKPLQALALGFGVAFVVALLPGIVRTLGPGGLRALGAALVVGGLVWWASGYFRRHVETRDETGLRRELADHCSALERERVRLAEMQAALEQLETAACAPEERDAVETARRELAGSLELTRAQVEAQRAAVSRLEVLLLLERAEPLLLGFAAADPDELRERLIRLDHVLGEGRSLAERLDREWAGAHDAEATGQTLLREALAELGRLRVEILTRRARALAGVGQARVELSAAAELSLERLDAMMSLVRASREMRELARQPATSAAAEEERQVLRRDGG